VCTLHIDYCIQVDLQSDYSTIHVKKTSAILYLDLRVLNLFLIYKSYYPIV